MVKNLIGVASIFSVCQASTTHHFVNGLILWLGILPKNRTGAYKYLEEMWRKKQSAAWHARNGATFATRGHYNLNCPSQGRKWYLLWLVFFPIETIRQKGSNLGAGAVMLFSNDAQTFWRGGTIASSHEDHNQKFGGESICWLTYGWLWYSLTRELWKRSIPLYPTD